MRLNPARALRSATAAFAGMLLACAATAQLPPQPTEAAVKAAYVYRFLAHVDWPPQALGDPSDPLVIGVAGGDDVGDELERVVAGRQVAGHPVQVRRLAGDEAAEPVHVMFVGRGVRQPSRLIQRLQGRPVLVVTDGGAGLDAGAMLHFVPVDGRVRFEASPAAAERSGIRLGARLLALAERVVTR
jgi:hypothetical protein